MISRDTGSLGMTKVAGTTRCIVGLNRSIDMNLLFQDRLDKSE
jgi:hypothetical protein